MPVMNGVTCTKLIREFESKSSRKPVPIIALTGMQKYTTQCL